MEPCLLFAGDLTVHVLHLALEVLPVDERTRVRLRKGLGLRHLVGTHIDLLPWGWDRDWILTSRCPVVQWGGRLDCGRPGIGLFVGMAGYAAADSLRHRRLSLQA